MELFEDQKEDGDEINVVWTKNMINGGRCPWPVLHGGGEMGSDFLFHIIPLRWVQNQRKDLHQQPWR